MTSTRKTAAPPGPAASSEERDVRRDGSALMAQTRDLAQKLTALADRYDALPTPLQPLRERERSVNIALMRLVAASGSRLATTWALCDQEQPERACGVPADPDASARARDAQARCRDDAAERRDQRASVRDRQARADTADLDPGFPDRFLSADDRDDAAGDRAAALEDRVAARRDRELRSAGAPAEEQHTDPRRLLEQLKAKETFHQAQGLLMARSGMTASDAFEALLRDAQQRGTSITEVAARLVRELSTSSTSELLSGPRHVDGT